MDQRFYRLHPGFLSEQSYPGCDNYRSLDRIQDPVVTKSAFTVKILIMERLWGVFRRQQKLAETVVFNIIINYSRQRTEPEKSTAILDHAIDMVG